MTDDAHVDESLASVKNLCEFAYERGYHEHGYDPYKVVADAIQALRARAETAERTVDRLALSLQADTETMLRANDCITKLEAEVVALREALREHTIVTWEERESESGNAGSTCLHCCTEWGRNEPERHVAGCLAEKDDTG